MSKFHVTSKGVFKCNAFVKECPYQSFDSAHDAEKFFNETSLTSDVERMHNYVGCKIDRNSRIIEDSLDVLKNVVGPEKFDLLKKAKVARDRGEKYHLTVVTPHELKKLPKNVDLPSNVKILTHGVGTVEDEKGNEAFYIVCSSEDIDKWREENGLNKHDLHITLGFLGKDVHHLPKNENTLIY